MNDKGFIVVHDLWLRDFVEKKVGGEAAEVDNHLDGEGML